MSNTKISTPGEKVLQKALLFLQGDKKTILEIFRLLRISTSEIATEPLKQNQHFEDHQKRTEAKTLNLIERELRIAVTKWAVKIGILKVGKEIPLTDTKILKRVSKDGTLMWEKRKEGLHNVIGFYDPLNTEFVHLVLDKID